MRNDSKETAALWQMNAALREAEVGTVTGAPAGHIGVGTGFHPGLEVLAALALARGETRPGADHSGRTEEKLPFENHSKRLLAAHDSRGDRTRRQASRTSYGIAGSGVSLRIGRATAGTSTGGTLILPMFAAKLIWEQRKGNWPPTSFRSDRPSRHRGELSLGALAHSQLGRARALTGDTAKRAKCLTRISSPSGKTLTPTSPS